MSQLDLKYGLSKLSASQLKELAEQALKLADGIPKRILPTIKERVKEDGWFISKHDLRDQLPPELRCIPLCVDFYDHDQDRDYDIYGNAEKLHTYRFANYQLSWYEKFDYGNYLYRDINKDHDPHFSSEITVYLYYHSIKHEWVEGSTVGIINESGYYQKWKVEGNKIKLYSASDDQYYYSLSDLGITEYTRDDTHLDQWFIVSLDDKSIIKLYPRPPPSPPIESEDD